jgi:hypothetical protein
MLERLLKYGKIIHILQTPNATRCIVNFYSAGVVTYDHVIASRSQSYDRELQRQRCKNLQHHE